MTQPSSTSDFPKPSESLIRLVANDTISKFERAVILRLWILKWWAWRDVPQGTLIQEWFSGTYLEHFTNISDDSILHEMDEYDFIGSAYEPCLGDLLFVRQHMQGEGQASVAEFYLQCFDLARKIKAEMTYPVSGLWMLGQVIGIDERWLPSVVAAGARAIIPELVAPVGQVDYGHLLGGITLEWGGAHDESMGRDRALRVLGFGRPAQRYRWPDGIGQKEYAEAYRGAMKLLHPDVVHVLGAAVQLRANLASVRLRSCYEALR